MNITKIHYWKNVLQQDTVEHVRICYSVDGKEVNLHEFGNNTVAAPQFYKAMEDFSEHVVNTCGLSSDLVSAIKVRQINISPSEDKEGNNTTKYTIISSLKAGLANAVLTVEVQHKNIPDGFEDAMNDIIVEAEKYVEGERAQTRLNFEENEDEPYDPEDDEITESDDEPSIFDDE